MAPDDAFVIAVNAGRVPLASLDGREPPIVVRSVFPVGHRYLTLDRSSREVVGSGWTHRPGITKKLAGLGVSGTPASQPGAPDIVPTTLFADDRHAGISAVLYSDAHAGWHAAEHGGRWGDDFIVVHNPFAPCSSRLPRGFFPRGREFIAEDASDGTLELVEVVEAVPAGR